SEDTERLMQWYEARKEARRLARQAQGFVVEEPVEEDILEAVRLREADEAEDAEAAAEDAGDRDRLFREAAEIVVQHQAGSTSLLQRRLNIGYGRAARIIDQLESAGILSGAKHGSSKPRDVLIGLEDIDRICGPRA